MKHRVCKAFSLVEVTLALGVASFCLIAVFGLIPVGVQTNRNATSQTAAAGILASVIADLRATTKPPTLNTSNQYQIVFGTSKTLYFDSVGRCSIDLNGSTKPDGTTWLPSLQIRYQLNITFPWNSGLAYGADLKVTWPAAATPANASGSTDTIPTVVQHGLPYVQLLVCTPSLHSYEVQLCNRYGESILYFEEKHNSVQDMIYDL